jgi:NTP pyrophosphatase (non-canonical NTP hydrolase)
MQVTVDNFVELAKRTESLNYYPQNHRLEHAIDGLVTEAGELADAMKKAKYYGKTLDLVNLKEEGGDVLWYLALMFDELGTDFEAEMARVIAKLKARFPQKFEQAEALNRDLVKEREVLEQDYAQRTSA